MKIVFWAVIILGLVGLGLILWPSPTESHANERTALYNLSSTVHRAEKSIDKGFEDMHRAFDNLDERLDLMTRQLNRIEDKLTDCEKRKEEEMVEDQQVGLLTCEQRAKILSTLLGHEAQWKSTVNHVAHKSTSFYEGYVDDVSGFYGNIRADGVYVTELLDCKKADEYLIERFEKITTELETLKNQVVGKTNER